MKEMRKVEWLSSNDPEAVKSAEGVLAHLCHSLQLLACPAQAQLSHFPARWVVLTDEMALDFDHGASCVSTYWKLSQEQVAKLTVLNEFLSEMSDSLNSDFWTGEALSSDSRWEEVRTLAKEALVSFGWPIEIPPPVREENGMLVDNGSYFIKGAIPS
jgi:hypothetical protein